MKRMLIVIGAVGVILYLLLLASAKADAEMWEIIQQADDEEDEWL